MNYEFKDTLDDEWANFISSDQNNDENSDSEMEQFDDNELNEEILSESVVFDLSTGAPKSSDIYVSTKTKIAYLNETVDLKNIFWKINVIPYSIPSSGVIKKQMKFNSSTNDELNTIMSKLNNEIFHDVHIITHIDNPNGRTKFKDIRKISIGISKKDLVSYRSKKKSAFYNCFVLILRLKVNNQKNENIYKEYHVKIFNTGKLEIPGIQNEEIFNIILSEIINILQPFYENKLMYQDNTTETVLINSNFNCGFFINREALYDILVYKYKIQSIYDPCSYPGIQSKFYYNPDIEIQNGIQIHEQNKNTNIKEISFMIFRTGSVLIVGKCDENVLMIIYEFLKNILNNEYKEICQQNKIIVNENNNENTNINNKIKSKKMRKRIITLTS